MAYRIEVSPTASKDIDNIIYWIEERSKSKVIPSRWFKDCYKAIQSLNENPDRCPYAPESEYLGIEIRQLLYGKKRQYRIIFTISTVNTFENKVYIHRVLRTSRKFLAGTNDLF
jgi:plasmid stabilization system protein ParE